MIREKDWVWTWIFKQQYISASTGEEETCGSPKHVPVYKSNASLEHHAKKVWCSGCDIFLLKYFKIENTRVLILTENLNIPTSFLNVSWFEKKTEFKFYSNFFFTKKLSKHDNSYFSKKK